MSQEPIPSIAQSIALRESFLSTTAESDIATKLSKLPQVVPGRYANNHTQEMVEVLMVDAVGIHYVDLKAVDEAATIFEHEGQTKTMNTAVFAFSHHLV